MIGDNPRSVREETDNESEVYDDGQEEEEEEEELPIRTKRNGRDEESGDEDNEDSSSSSEDEIPHADLPKDELGKYVCPFTLNRPPLMPVCECPARKTKIAVHGFIIFRLIIDKTTLATNTVRRKEEGCCEWRHLPSNE